MKLRKSLSYKIITAVSILFLIAAASDIKVKNGFSLNNLLISAEEIHHGGPGKDGIPAIDRPKFIKASQVKFLKPNDLVVSVEYQGARRAYPIAILNWHEIVNDTIAGDTLVISYCPLCGSAVTFKLQGIGHAFGVSGLLYNSDVLLYDRKTESLWSQILAKSISGKRAGETLEVIPSILASWDEWQDENPEDLVLSTNTGFKRDYSKDPYFGYESSNQIYFPIKFRNKKLHPKSRVLGLEWQGKYKAYPFSELAKTKSPLKDVFNGGHFKINFDASRNTGKIETVNGQTLPALNSFWFAWYTFHPDTEIFNVSN